MRLSLNTWQPLRIRRKDALFTGGVLLVYHGNAFGRGDKTGVLVACIPADGKLDLKALAAASGNKKVELYLAGPLASAPVAEIGFRSIRAPEVVLLLAPLVLLAA